jgi:DNA polymerase II large subunit
MAKQIESAMSKQIQTYFNRIETKVRDAFELARIARAKGKDPSLEVEIQLAEDLASRVEAMVGPEQIATKIRDQMKVKSGREEVALQIAKEIAKNEFNKRGSAAAAIDRAIRTGLAILTGGVLVAPLEGIAGVKIKRNSDTTKYVDLFFASPIRSAGGTAQALTVLIADVVRRKMGIDRYKPTKKEVERYKEEVSLYKQVASLQYLPSPDEIETIAKGCPICIDGEPTESREVQGNRDLKRVETNRIRGGAMLVLAEGLCLKAPKLQKLVKRLHLQGWDFLDKLVNKRVENKGKEIPGIPKILPSATYIKEIIAGRPVFAHPSREGGFCLRYGRARNSGYASVAINPATMHLLDNFLAIGTQIKTERPGKSATVGACEEIEGPIVLLKNGDLIQVNSFREAKKIKQEVAAIIGLGELLVPFGEFLENNVLLPPGAYSFEWWIQDMEQRFAILPKELTPSKIREADKLAEAKVKESFGEIDLKHLSAEQAFILSSIFDIPLHPNYNLFWHDLVIEEVAQLTAYIKEKGVYGEGKLVLPLDGSIKGLLIKLGALHLQKNNSLIIEKYAYPLIRGCGLEVRKGKLVEERDFTRFASKASSTLDLVSKLSGIKLMPRCLTRIGARMGRPEKAAPRRMQPSPNMLYPLGNFGGKQRILQEAAKKKRISLEVGLRKCKKCGLETHLFECSRCGTHTYPIKRRILKEEIDLSKEIAHAKENLNEFTFPKVKGVKGLISESKTPESLEKGILRSKQGVWVFKDGTIRFDQTNAPLTHFKPSEIGISIEELKKLGYARDCFGNELTSENQLCELFPQDIILPLKAGKYLLASARFVDDLLEKFYGLDRFYRVNKLEELIGELVIGLSPHTSGGIIGRIIGFGPAEVGWAHPYWHAAKRRNCLFPETDVLILNQGKPKIVGIKNLYETTSSEETIIDDFGTMGKKTKGLKIFAFNPKRDEFEGKEIKSIIKTPSPRYLLEIETKSGKRFLASKEHRIIVYSDNGLKAKKIIELNKDSILLPEKINIKEKDIGEIDLLKEFWLPRLSSLITVRNIKDFLRNLLNRIGGLKESGKKLKINKKTLSNYIYRDSIPLTVLKDILSLCNGEFNWLPKDCKLAAKRDKIVLPRTIKVNGEFMRLIGYYLSEGYLRSGVRCYQVNLVFSERELLEDYIKCIEKVFNIKPCIGKDSVTISSRLIYHLFRDILQIGKNAHQKRIPPLFFALPKEKIRELLKAYFSGDGSVEKGRLHVTCLSVNEKLIRDIGLLLLRFGIFYRLKRERRKAGGIVKEFYLKKGLKIPEFETCRISIRSSYARKFYEEIGFSLSRKQKALESALSKERKPRVKKFKNFILDEIKQINILDSLPDYLYDLEVKDHHNFLINDFILSSNCDGDEDAVMLLMDALLNFSRSYLPEKRGGKMDAPLLLTTRINPLEVDEEVYNFDLLPRYPLSFYQSTLKHAHPKEIEGKMRLVSSCLGTKNQYEDFCFTHQTNDILGGPLISAYKTLETMDEKIHAQLELAKKIRAVNEDDVASKLISSHFLRDLVGNLRTFSKQSFRCLNCNAKYRRIPLQGRCLKCGGKLTLTVHEQSIKKYLDIAKDIANNYEVSPYLKQRIKLIEANLDSMFAKGKVTKTKLSDFF